MTRRQFTQSTQTVFAGLLCGAAFSGLVSGLPPYRFSPEHRRPVETTLSDLNDIASRHPVGGRERERFNNAMQHLHEFGDRLHEGGTFDKGKLDQAIGDVQNVIDHNRLGPREHEMLTRDVNDLRDLRQHYDDRNRYH